GPGLHPPRYPRHFLCPSKNSASYFLVFATHFSTAFSENWKKMPSPRVSEAGIHVGSRRDSRIRRSGGTSSGLSKSRGDSIRVKPISARTSRSFSTRTTLSKDLRKSSGGSTARSLKNLLSWADDGLENTPHSGDFRSDGSSVAWSPPCRLFSTA